MVTLPSADENMVYAIVKAIDEGYDSFKGLGQGLEEWTIENALDLEWLAIPQHVPEPYHAGAVKYFKEKGLWTAKHEAWQRERLKLYPKLRAEFEKDPVAWYQKYSNEAIMPEPCRYDPQAGVIPERIQSRA